jgi:hypothetical protein
MTTKMRSMQKTKGGRRRSYVVEVKVPGLSFDEISVLLSGIEEHMSSNLELKSCTIAKAGPTINNDGEEEEVHGKTVISGVLATRCLLDKAQFLHDFEARLVRGVYGEKKTESKLGSLTINGEEKILQPRRRRKKEISE